MSQNLLLEAISRSRKGSRDALLARVIDLKGFGGATRVGQLLLIDRTESLGSMLGSQPAQRLALLARQLMEDQTFTSGELQLEVGDAEAVASGMACGGVARILIQRVEQLPLLLEDLQSKRTPFALVTPLGDLAQEYVEVLTDATTWNETKLPEGIFIACRALLKRRRVGGSILSDAGAEFHVEVFSYPTKVLVVGEGKLCESIGRLCDFLSWEFSVLGTESSERAQELALGPADALVVLSHDHELTTPILQRVLLSHGNCYIGSLGSRGTQLERKNRLKELGLDGDDIQNVYGPAGLDLGSQTVQESALSIVAEIQCHKTSRQPVHLRDTTGPING